MRHGFLRLPTLLLVLALTAANCGGGGGGAEDQPQLFSGEYVYVQLAGPVGGPSLRGEVGRAGADGVGVLTFLEGFATEEGALTGPYVPPARSYRVDADRELTLVDIASLQVKGRLAADGSLAALAADTEQGLAPPVVLLLARRAIAPTQADLVGTWILVSMGRASEASSHATGAVGAVGIDAAGGVTYSDYVPNTDGVIPATQPAFLSSTIAPTSGGWVEWTNQSATQVLFLGGMSADRNLLLLLSREDSGSHAVVRALVRGGQVTSIADVAGTYGLSGFVALTAAWNSGTFPAILNGSGGGTLASGSFPVTYGVGPTGDMSLTVGGEYVLEGGVGSGGRYAFVGGPTTDGVTPIFFTLVQ